MPAENTTPSTPATPPAPTQADMDSLKSKLADAEAYIKKLETRPKPSITSSLAQQLFLQNLGLVNAPNLTRAWQWTEEQLKFLEQKLDV